MTIIVNRQDYEALSDKLSDGMSFYCIRRPSHASKYRDQGPLESVESLLPKAAAIANEGPI